MDQCARETDDLMLDEKFEPIKIEDYALNEVSLTDRIKPPLKQFMPHMESIDVYLALKENRIFARHMKSEIAAMSIVIFNHFQSLVVAHFSK